MREDKRPRKAGGNYIYLRCDTKRCNEVRLDSEPIEMTFCLHLLGISHAIHRILDCDSAYGVTKAEGRTLAEVEEILQKTDARLALLEGLFIDGRIEKSNPRYLAARDQHAAAEAERERFAARRKDKREELHDLAETIRAFWYATPDTAVALAWLGGDDEKKRELVRRTLATLTFYPDRVTFSFRLDLPNSVAIDRPYLFERHARFTRRDRLDHAAAAAQSP
jgi:hypothetical protein